MAQFQLTSPTNVKMNQLSADFNLSESFFTETSSWEIAHIKEKQYPGITSVHEITLIWEFEFQNAKKEPFLSYRSEQKCVLLYSHTPDIQERFMNMLVASWSWNYREFETLKSGTMYEQVILPDPKLDPEKVAESTDFLLASDNPS